MLASALILSSVFFPTAAQAVIIKAEWSLWRSRSTRQMNICVPLQNWRIRNSISIVFAFSSYGFFVDLIFQEKLSTMVV